MLFNSIEFFLFLPVALSLFALLPERQRWVWLLLASYAFYGAWRPANLVYLGAVTLAVIACGRAVGLAQSRPARGFLLAIGLVAVLGSLFAFKFYDFVAGELAFLVALPRMGVTTPVGYSFYAFMAASYLVDAHAGRLPAGRHAGHDALYIAWFPKILAGPIERATTFLPQVAGGLRADPAKLVAGFQLIGWGLVKKVVIADNLAPLVDRAYSIAAYATPVDLLIGAYLFAFQIYCDFSGYADIAIGVSLLFGIRLMENFRRPYLSRSTAEFWGQRWHISLGHWFRDYLYIPLGGSRAGAVRRYANVMAVFLVSGLWHAGLGYGVGWTFLIWGALNGLYQWIGLATAPLWRRLDRLFPHVAAGKIWLVARVLFTFHLITVAWVFFRAQSLSDALLILQKIAMGLPKMPALLTHYPFTSDHWLAAGMIALLVGIEILDERRPLRERFAVMPVVLRWSVYYAAIFALLILGRWQAREFIYMQF